MSHSVLPPVATLPTLSHVERTKVLDLLFEPSLRLHAVALDITTSGPNQGHYSSYAALIDAIHTKLTALATGASQIDREHLDAILGAHPRLGAAKVDSAQSRVEQARLNDGAEEEAQRLKGLNEEYEATFPSLRYVVFVNARGREEIMQDMRRRIERGDLEMERSEAIQAMCDIAKDRAKKLQASSDGGGAS